MGATTSTVQEEAIPVEWRQAWPVPAPLEVEWLGEIEFNGITIKRLRFTGSVWNGKPQRFYGLYAQPETTSSERFPAIVQIHGGGQTCYPQNVDWFVKHGYACLAFDWAGPRDERPPDQVTQWLPGIVTSLTDEATEGPKQMMLFHAVLAARRAIDVLEQQPMVDSSRIGVQGISWGGQLAWLVASLEPRVRAVVPVYGAGGVSTDWNSMGMGLRREKPEWLERWTEYFDPGSLAGSLQAPVFFVNGTNDFFGQLVTAEELLGTVSQPRWRSYAANRMHSLDPGSVTAAMEWLDYQLKGKSAFPSEPELTLKTDATRRLIASVTADGPEEPESVWVNLSRGENHDLLKCWLTIPAIRTGPRQYECEVPLISSTMSIAAIGQVAYASGMMLSSKVHSGIPARDWPGEGGSAPVAKAETTSTISGWNHGTSGWYIPRGTDFTHSKEPPAELTTAALSGRIGLTLDSEKGPAEFHLATRLPADTGVDKGNRSNLELWTHDVASVKVRLNWFLRQPNSRVWEAEVSPGKGWVRTILRLDQFKEFDEDRGALVETSSSPATWNDLKQINLVGQASPEGTVGVGLIGWTTEP